MNNLSSEDVKRIAPFRLGSHFLEIEKGLHCIPNAPWKDRIRQRRASNKAMPYIFLKNDIISV